MIDNICKSEIRKPYLLFGDRFQFDDYIKELVKSINQLTSSINEIDNDIMKSNINFESLSKLVQINKIIEKLIPLLNAKYSENNGQPNRLSYINDHLKELEKKLNYMKSYINKLNQSVSHILKQNYNEALASNRKSSFSNNYCIPFPSPENQDITKSIFSSLSNCDFLSSPFLSLDDDDSISCCLEELECTIGPFVPDLYSGNITVNFISFIDNPITITVKTIDEEFQSLFCSATFEPKDIIKIYISLSNSLLEKHESYDIEADITFSSPGLNSLILPAVFHIVIAPQVIYLSCDKYLISYKQNNNNFYLCTDKLISNEELNFLIHNHNLKESLNYKVQFESFEGNESPKPNYNTYTKDNLYMCIQKVTKPTRIHCAIHLKFSENLQTSIIIDSIILPFDFTFSLYDYLQRNYVTDHSRIMYSNQFFNRQIVLHCKISSPYFELLKEKSVIFKGSFSSRLLQGIQITNNDLSEKFDIDKETDFNIYINIKETLLYNTSNENYILVNINNVEKKIKLVFEFPENIIDSSGKLIPHNLGKYNFYCGLREENKHWIKINLTTTLEDILAICSPFNSQQIKQFKVNYSNSDCSINSKENLFVYLSTNGTIDIQKEEKTQDESIFKKFLSNFDIPLVETNLKIPLFGICQGEWYPVYDKYSNRIKNSKFYEIEKENIEKAKNFFDKKSLNMKLNFEKIVSLMFNNEKMIISLKKIFNTEELKCFKENFDDADKIISYIDQFEINEKNLQPVFAYNIIKIFNDSFSKRFNELSKNNFQLKSKYLNDQFDKKSNELYERYCSIDNDVFMKNIFKSSHEIKRLQKSISSIKCDELPPLKEQNEAYLIGFKIIPVEKNISPEFISISSNVFNTLSKNINVHLPEISLPSTSDLDELSIFQMNEFYQTCLKGTRILPIFIKNIVNNKTDEKIDQALDYLISLYRVFKSVQNSDKSIVSQSVNEFRDSFCSMIGKFTKAGMNFSAFIPQRLIPNNEINQDFISYPFKKYGFLPQDSWNDKLNQENNNNFTFQHALSNIKQIRVGEILSIEEESEFFDDTKQTTEKEPQIIKSEIKSAKAENIQISTIKSINLNNDDNEEEEDSNNESEYDKTDEKTDKSNKVHVTMDKESVEISNENLDGLLSNFSEKDSIKASIARMNEKNELSTLEINVCQPPKIDPQFFKQPAKADINDLPVNSLNEHSLSLTHRLIIAISNQEIPFSNFCVNIIVDCSCFISLENKMFNMLLICALTNALNVLSIPYSVAVFGDSNFKCIIKTFDEIHSPFV